MSPPDRRAGALVQRLAALLCLTGAAIFGALAVLIGRLDHVIAGGESRYRLPGGALLDPTALTVVTLCAGLFALSGIGLFLLAPGWPRAPRAATTSALPRRRPALVLLLGLAALLAVLAMRHLRS